ncbi:hypothetical protein DJ018_07945 [Phenylobacterium deserti]|uniref:Uncharacterized protein n=1 Tax=Phenylobacterium deserti TaxID=1914756 RepID=A0A328AW89_9CAUL|nr:hypothetical protein DJ018_07945 [Phenylobacterium deserti]
MKVQTPAIRLPVRWRGARRELRFGAHNFVALMDETGRVLREFHGIARGPSGAQLRIFGGIVPFAEEYIWGETFHGRTGFYDESFPQGELFAGPPEVVEPKLQAAAALQAAVNARNIRYPWPATLGSNSNAYFATLLAAMDLKDVRLPGQLWAPSAGRRLLADADLKSLVRA